MIEKRMFRENEIDWEGAGIYARVLDPDGKRGLYWTKINNFSLVEATLMVGYPLAYVYESDLMKTRGEAHDV